MPCLQTAHGSSCQPPAVGGSQLPSPQGLQRGALPNWCLWELLGSGVCRALHHSVCSRGLAATWPQWQQEQQWPHGSMLMSGGCHHQILVHRSQGWAPKPPGRCGGRCPPYAQLACLPQACLQSKARAWKLSRASGTEIGECSPLTPTCPQARQAGRKHPVRFHPAFKSQRWT